jgi:hypothetical protein
MVPFLAPSFWSFPPIRAETLNTIITHPTEAFWGTAIVLVGVPGYLYWKSRNRKTAGKGFR